ncbi:MAG TPA: spore gernimation protein GerPD [Bacillota bacterium]|nr:spore gernimation protein GerPD [Bacillota bacterium]
MKLIIENGHLNVKEIKITSLATSSLVFIGDCHTVKLKNWFEEPPDRMIVGVTPGLGGSELEGEGIDEL